MAYQQKTNKDKQEAKVIQGRYWKLNSVTWDPEKVGQNSKQYLPNRYLLYIVEYLFNRKPELLQWNKKLNPSLS